MSFSNCKFCGGALLYNRFSHINICINCNAQFGEEYLLFNKKLGNEEYVIYIHNSTRIYYNNQGALCDKDIIFYSEHDIGLTPQNLTKEKLEMLLIFQ